MMTVAPPIAACFVGLGLTLGAGGVQAQEPGAEESAQELAAAQAELASQREQLGAAFDALERLVLDLEDDYVALTTGPEAPARRQGLALALLDSVGAAEARIAAQAAQGRSVLRGSRARILREVFAEPVRQTPLLDPRLAGWIADQVATSLSARNTLEGLVVDDLLRAIADLFEPDESWHAFWNRRFHLTLAEAEAYSAALASYEAAGLAVDRLRHPERYGPRGEPAPAGMVVIPGGTYELGPNAGWQRAARRVTLSPFALDRREVTCREYVHYVRAQAPAERAELLPRDWELDGRGEPIPPEGRRDHPVTGVSWNQAAGYAAWAGKRLPTEDEWEAAAAGPDGYAYPWGNEFQPGMANGAGVASDTVPVESYPAARSAAGCVDMAGNVWEWTATLDDGSDITELPEGLVNVVIRGGSWASPRHELTTRYRWTSPGQAVGRRSTVDRPIGFRCAKDLSSR